jgi:hypothetical protein
MKNRLHRHHTRVTAGCGEYESVAYKITVLFLLKQHMQGTVLVKYRRWLLYLPNKIRQPNMFYMPLIFYVPQYFCNLNIIIIIIIIIIL